jgi:hypothetical protein
MVVENQMAAGVTVWSRNAEVPQGGAPGGVYQRLAFTTDDRPGPDNVLCLWA